MHRRTSHQAHDAIQPNVAVLRARVAKLLIDRGTDGAIDEEMQISLEMNGNTQRPRRWELMGDGFVKDSGLRRKTAANRNAVVWIYVHDPDEQAELKLIEGAKRRHRQTIKNIAALLKGKTQDELDQFLAQLG